MQIFFLRDDKDETHFPSIKVSYRIGYSSLKILVKKQNQNKVIHEIS